MAEVIQIEHTDECVSTNNFPHAEWDFDTFNPLQTKLLETYEGDSNIAIAAATSSGKTVCAEMYMSYEVRKRGGKAVYVGPLKALAKEKEEDWTSDEHHFHDLNVSIITGDFRLTARRQDELNKSDVIVMTPEMMASRCRNSTSEKSDFLKNVGTVVFDECFTEDALVLTEVGYISIGKIIDCKMDVKVASYNHKTNLVEYKKIVEFQKKPLVKKWYSITYNGGNIIVTENQAIWVENKGYVAAKDVCPKDVLLIGDHHGKNKKFNKNESNVREIKKVSSTESICCDLEIEGNNNFFVMQPGSVSPVLCHNSHLLTVPGRGDHIEVALMKLVEINPNVRIVLLSATMPNVDEICEWTTRLTGRDTHYLLSEYRPCPLNIHYEDYWDGERTYEANEIQKVGKACGIVEYYNEDKFLIFVHTKRTGRMMLEHLKRYGIDAEFHNADLNLKQRMDLEKRFKSKDGIRVIVATSTLAWGCYEHGSRLLTPSGRLIDVADVEEGTKLWCPVNDLTYRERKVVRAESFKADSGVEIILESGEQVRVSCDHVFFAASKRNSPDWIKIKDLSKGDFIARPSDTHMWRSQSKFNRFWYLVGFILGDGCLCDVGNHADGSQKVMLDICLGKNDNHLFYIKECFDKQFGIETKVNSDINKVDHISTKKKSVIDQLLHLLPLGRKQGNDDLPLEAYENKEYVSNLISGLFDADGGVESHGNDNYSVGLTNISKDLIESVRTVLLGFGIVSSFGKKRMEDSVINGRFQKAVREYSYRLRIFEKQNLLKFKKFIGFHNVEKSDYLDRILNLEFNYEKDLVPARDLIEDHLNHNFMKASHFREITGSDLWNSVHIQDCRRDTLIKLIMMSDNVDTKLCRLLENPVRWSRIKKIEFFEGGIFREIEVEDPHAYVGSGVISHNCNLPARRVIVTGVHRGLGEVENYDIWQMVGRAGRPRFDPVGDAYILIPESNKKSWISKLKKNTLIKSTLLDYVGNEENPHYKTLAFHVVSEIHYGNIKTADGFKDWFRDSLAHYQDVGFDDTVIDRTIQLLLQYKAIRIEDGEYKCTPVGMIASMYYYSPFDVSDLRRNFHFVFEKKMDDNDYALAMAMGNIDTYRWGVTSKHEKKQMAAFQSKIERMFGSYTFTGAAVKTGYAYYNMLKGKRNDPTFGVLQGALSVDLDRTMQVVHSIDAMSSKWGRKDWFKILRLRLLYGVEPELVQLCQIPNIGQVRAKRLYANRIRNVDDFLAYDVSTLMKVMKCGKKLTEESLEAARLLQLKESLH